MRLLLFINLQIIRLEQELISGRGYIFGSFWGGVIWTYTTLMAKYATIENESSLLFIEAQSRIKFCLIAFLTHVRYDTRV